MKEIDRRDLLKTVGGSVAVTGTAGLLSGQAAANATTQIEISGNGSGSHYYELRVSNAAGLVYDTYENEANDNISSDDGDAIIEGYLYDYGQDRFTVDQNDTDLNIRYASVDGDVYIEQEKDIETKSENYSYGFRGDGEYSLYTNYGLCYCSDEKDCTYTTNCTDPAAYDWNPSTDETGMTDYSSYVKGIVSPYEKDDYVVTGDVTFISLKGDVTMKPW